MKLKEFKEKFDPLLFGFIDNKINQVSDDKDFNFLENQLIYLKLFLKDGKRVRPFNAYLTYTSFGGKKEILDSLIFMELFHNFCLIHDDIMDNSKTRHSLSTINNKFGISNAILLGDYLYSWSWDAINNTKLENKILSELKNIFSEMTAEVFLGQAIDINLETKKQISDELLLKKTLLKTAGYTFTKPMLIGLLLSGKYNLENKKLIKKLGENLGLAFQIQDDLLDITSNFEGKKKPLSDIEEGKHTLITNFVFEKGNKLQKEKLKKSFGNKINNLNETREIFYESGAVRFAENLINDYYENSKNIVKEKKDFLEFIEILENRKS